VLNTPFKLRVRGGAAAVALPCTSLTVMHIFIGSVYSLFELIGNKTEKISYNSLLFMAAYRFNVCYGFFLKRSLLLRLCKPTQLLLRRTEARALAFQV
jgi:hypothetical protein